GAAAQSPQELWRQGDFVAAYESASRQANAQMLELAARASADQAVHVLAPAGSSPDEQLMWLRRSVNAAEQAVAFDPSSATALVHLARARGEIARRSGVLQNLNVAGELKRLFDQALELDPTNPDALVGLGMWHLELVQN